MLAFLLVPAGRSWSGAFKGAHGGWTLSQHPAALPPAVLGVLPHEHQDQPDHGAPRRGDRLLIAYSATGTGRPRWVRSSSHHVLGRRGELRRHPARLRLHRDDRHARHRHELPRATSSALATSTATASRLFSTTGIEIVYLYFQIPLMILVIAPAIDGLSRAWREAASNLGASTWQFWRYVGLPVLTPSLLGAVILLFGNAFSAYATAYAIDNGLDPARADRDRRVLHRATCSRTRTSPRRSPSGCSSCSP